MTCDVRTGLNGSTKIRNESRRQLAVYSTVKESFIFIFTIQAFISKIFSGNILSSVFWVSLLLWEAPQLTDLSCSRKDCGTVKLKSINHFSVPSRKDCGTVKLKSINHFSVPFLTLLMCEPNLTKKVKETKTLSYLHNEEHIPAR